MAFQVLNQDRAAMIRGINGSVGGEVHISTLVNDDYSSGDSSSDEETDKQPQSPIVQAGDTTSDPDAAKNDQPAAKKKQVARKRKTEAEKLQPFDWDRRKNLYPPNNDRFGIPRAQYQPQSEGSDDSSGEDATEPQSPVHQIPAFTGAIAAAAAPGPPGNGHVSDRNATSDSGKEDPMDTNDEYQLAKRQREELRSKERLKKRKLSEKKRSPSTTDKEEVVAHKTNQEQGASLIRNNDGAGPSKIVVIGNEPEKAAAAAAAAAAIVPPAPAVASRRRSATTNRTGMGKGRGRPRSKWSSISREDRYRRRLNLKDDNGEDTSNINQAGAPDALITPGPTAPPPAPPSATKPTVPPNRPKDALTARKSVNPRKVPVRSPVPAVEEEAVPNLAPVTAAQHAPPSQPQPVTAVSPFSAPRPTPTSTPNTPGGLARIVMEYVLPLSSNLPTGTVGGYLSLFARMTEEKQEQHAVFVTGLAQGASAELQAFVQRHSQ